LYDGDQSFNFAMIISRVSSYIIMHTTLNSTINPITVSTTLIT
jgi:hypothetical protein